MFSFNRRPSTWTEPAPPASVPASTAMMAAEFADRPFGSHGELLLPPPPGSTNVEPGVPLRIEPWPEEERRRAAGEPEPAKDEISALDRMRLDAGDVDWPEAPGPPLVLAPLQRPRIPAVDWRAEERARIRPELPLEETPGRYPPPAREAS